MPSPTTIKYKCDICGMKFDTIEKAQECESLNTLRVDPQFTVGTRIELPYKVICGNNLNAFTTYGVIDSLFIERVWNGKKYFHLQSAIVDVMVLEDPRYSSGSVILHPESIKKLYTGKTFEEFHGCTFSQWLKKQRSE